MWIHQTASVTGVRAKEGVFFDLSTLHGLVVSAGGPFRAFARADEIELRQASFALAV